MRRQIAGEVARFLPPGHSSSVKSIGQFSMPIAHAVLLGESDERPPGLEETRPVVLDALRPVAADERVHVLQPEQSRGDDDFLANARRTLRLPPRRDRADSDSSRGAERATPCCAQSAFTSSARARVKSVDSTCVTPAYLRSALPTGQHITSTQAKPSSRGEGEHFIEGEFGEDGGDEAEFHDHEWTRMDTNEETRMDPRTDPDKEGVGRRGTWCGGRLETGAALAVCSALLAEIYSCSFVFIRGHPLLRPMAAEDGVADKHFVMPVRRRGVKRRGGFTTRNVGIDRAVEHLESVGKTLGVAWRIVRETRRVGEARARALGFAICVVAAAVVDHIRLLAVPRGGATRAVDFQADAVFPPRGDLRHRDIAERSAAKTEQDIGEVLVSTA